MKRLNLGAGRTFIPGFINIDIDEKADICLNLSEDPLPFESNSIDLIFSYHTLEHIPNYLFALSEIYRVLIPGGILLLGVPYVTLTKYNLVNPYHLHNFNEHSFMFFDSLKGSAIEKNKIAFRKIYHRYYYIGIFRLLPYPLNRICKDHLFNVVRKIDFGLYAIKDHESLPVVPSARDLKSLFKDLLNQRRPYGTDKIPPKTFSVKSAIASLKMWWHGHI